MSTIMLSRKFVIDFTLLFEQPSISAKQQQIQGKLIQVEFNSASEYEIKIKVLPLYRLSFDS